MESFPSPNMVKYESNIFGIYLNNCWQYLLKRKILMTISGGKKLMVNYILLSHSIFVHI